MELLVTADEMRKIEHNVINEFGLPAVVLMERAALRTAQQIAKEAESYQNPCILIACGMGNNGADGLALARILVEKGFRVTVVTAGDDTKRTELNRMQYHCYRALVPSDKAREITIADLEGVTKENPYEYAIIVDAVLGIGVSRALTGEFAHLVRLLNCLTGFKIAMDMPTGIHTDTGEALGEAFRADKTVCFGVVKTGVCLGDGELAAGEVLCDSCGMLYPKNFMSVQNTVCSDISGIFPKDIQETDSDTHSTASTALCHSMTFTVTKKDLPMFLRRSANGNKGSFGKLGMIVGSQNVPGAAILATSAAFRSGAGYIRVLTHAANRDVIMGKTPEAVLHLYKQSEEAAEYLDGLLSFADVVTAGCGIGTDKAAESLLEKLFVAVMQKKLKALVLDADALTILAQNDTLKEELKEIPFPVILTPHMKEFERLSGIEVRDIAKDRIRIAREFAGTYGVILVLKDAQTVTVSPDGRCMVNRYGNDGMAVAGSGDVLCGVISSMAGQNEDIYGAVCAGVCLHSLAGDAAKKELGAHGLLPGDIVRKLPDVIRKCHESK